MSISQDCFYPKDIDTFISKVMVLQQQGSVLYKKFDGKYLIEYLDRSKIQAIQRSFESNTKKMCLVDFVKFFLGMIQHDEIQTLYLAMALIDTFKEISTKNKQKEIAFLDLTNHLCQTITEKNTNIKIPFKLFPVEKSQNSNLNTVRDIDKKAPIIYQRVSLSLPKINQQKVKTDKTAHSSGPVSQVIYAIQMNKILALDTLSPSIKIFDTNLNFKSQLTPHQIGKNVKDMAILNFAYSQKQQRIGCIIKDIGMSFWEASDGFTTQKKINKSKGQKIYYFQLFQEWITTQKSYTQLWDIKEERIKLSLDGIPGSNINSICEIPLLRVICVAYTGTQSQKQLILYQNFRQITRMPLGHAGCHTLHYNKTTQTLIPIGYKISVSVYQIHPQYFDFTLLAQLKGHSSLVTCVSDVDNTSLIVTGDDTGSIRVWDLRTLKCVQVVKVARWLSFLLYINDSKLIFTDSRINLTNFEKIKGNIIQKQHISPLNAIYSAETGTIIVATSKQIRMYNAKTGQLIQIYQVALEDQLTFFDYFQGQTFIGGTQQGKIKIYNSNGETKSEIAAHTNQISFLKPNTSNKILVSSSWDSDIHIWRERNKGKPKGKQVSPSQQDLNLEFKSHNHVRSIKNNHFGKEVSILQVSLQLNLLITGSVQRKVYLWDFQYSKLLAQINLSAQPNCMLFVHLYSLLIIGCSDGMTYIFKINRKESKLSVELVKYIIRSVDNSFQFQLFSTEVPSSSFSNLQILEKLDTEQKQKILTPSQFYIDMIQKGFNLYIGYSKGKLSFDKFDNQNLPLEQQYDQTTKYNYTPFRSSNQDFNIQHFKNQYLKIDILECINDEKKHSLPALWINQIHKQSIKSINIIQENQRYLITSSTDGYFKVVNILNGQIVCSMNINYALPIRWDLKLDILHKAKQRVLLALKTIQLIFQKYQSTLTAHQGRSISLKRILSKSNQMQLVKRQKQIKPKIFADEYQPIDLNPTYPKVKTIPTLKELETYKRVYLNGSGFKRQNIEDKIKTFKTPNYQRSQQRDQYQFLSPYYLPKIANKGANTSPPTNDAYMKSLVAIFQNKGNQQESHMIKKKTQSKVKVDFIEYAKGKQYLNSQNNQSVDASFSRLLTNLNSKKQFSKRKQNKGKQASDWNLSTLNTSVSQMSHISHISHISQIRQFK